MKLWRQRQAQAKNKRKGISNGIGSASLGDLSLSRTRDDDSDDGQQLGLSNGESARSGPDATGSSRLPFPRHGSSSSSEGLSPPKTLRARAISTPKLRPKTWVSNLIAATGNNSVNKASGLESTSQATARAAALLSPRPVPVSALVLSRENDESDRAQAEAALRQVEAEAAVDAAMGRRDSASSGSALSSVVTSQLSRSAPSLPLSNTVMRYQDNGALDLLPPLTPAMERYTLHDEPATEREPEPEEEMMLMVRNLDEAPRGTLTPAMDPPLTTNLPGPSRLRNPWDPRSEEDDLVDAALAQSRETNQLAVEEEAVLSMLDAMSQMSRSSVAPPSSYESCPQDRLEPPPPPSPASQYSTDYKSPVPSEVSRFSQASGASSALLPAGASRSVKDAIWEREELDRAASMATSSAPDAQPTGWFARGSALRKKASTYFSAVGWDAADKATGDDAKDSGQEEAASADPATAAAPTTASAPPAADETAANSSTSATSSISATSGIVATIAADDVRPPVLANQASSSAYYDHGDRKATDGGPSPTSRGSVFARMQQLQQPPPRSQPDGLLRPSMQPRASEFSISSSLGGGLYGYNDNNMSRRLLSPTSPMEGSVLSSNGNATSLWSRPAHAPDTPNTSYDARSPNLPSGLSRWSSVNKFGGVSGSTTKAGYPLETANTAGSSLRLAPKFRRQATSWTEATSVASELDGGDDGVEAKDAIRVTVTAADSSAAGTEAEVRKDENEAASAVLSHLNRRSISRSESSATGSLVGAKGSRSAVGSAPPPSEVSTVLGSRLSRQPLRVSSQVAIDPAPLSPLPPSPTKAKDLIRFFEAGGTPKPADSPKGTMGSPTPGKAGLQSARKVPSEVALDDDDEAIRQITPKKLVVPFGASNSNPATLAVRESPFGTPAPPPLTAKLRTVGVAGRTGLRSRVGGLVAAGEGGAVTLDDADPSDDENVAPSEQATPTHSGLASRRHLSGNPSGSRPLLSSSIAGPTERSAHVRSGSTPVFLSAATTVASAGGPVGFDVAATAASTLIQTSSTHGALGGAAGPTAATGASSAANGKKFGGAGGGFLFRSSVRNLVNAFSGRASNDEPGPSRAVEKFRTLKKATSMGWDYTKEPWETQQADVEARKREDDGDKGEDKDEDKDETTSVASRMTLGTMASFKHKVETGDLPPSAASAVELSGEPSSTQPVRSGVLFYFNVHQREPHWQRVQVVLLPSAVAMSWIPAGGGRENVVLDLRACREVHSVPSPDHPSSVSDIGATCARKQGLSRLCPFQLIFDDGVERLAAEVAIERVKWVNSIWDVTDASSKNRPAPSDARQRPPHTDLSELRWPPRQVPTSSKQEAAVAPSEREPRSRSHTETTALPDASILGPDDPAVSPKRTLPASRSVNTVEAIDRIGSIWKSELSSDVETRDHQHSIAEALALGPPVPPKDSAAASRLALPSTDALSSSALGRRQKVRSWRKKEQQQDGDEPAEAYVHDSTARTPTVVQSPEFGIRSQPASFAGDRSDAQTLTESELARPASKVNGHEQDTAETADAAQHWPAPVVDAPAGNEAASRAPEIDALAEEGPVTTKPQTEDIISPADTSPELDGYESVPSRSSQLDEFGPRTPVSEAVFNWSRSKPDNEIRPSDSASQRPARSEYGTITSRVSAADNRPPKEQAAATQPAMVPPPTEAGSAAVVPTDKDDCDPRTPAQRIRDSVLGDAPDAMTEEALAQNEDLILADAAHVGAAAPQPVHRLGTVIEETQSQAQSTRVSGQLTSTPNVPPTRDASEAGQAAASAEALWHSLKSPSGESRVSRRTASTSYSQDVYRLLEHLEQQQRAHMEREKLMEEQIRSFQDVISGLQTKSASGSIRSKRTHRRSSASTSGETRTTSRSDRDAELAAMQAKLDKVLDLVSNVVSSQSQQNLADAGGGDARSGASASRSELARIESTLEKLVRQISSTDVASMAKVERSRSIVRDAVMTRDPELVNEWDQLPPELRGAELMRSMEERARYGHDGRHDAIAQDLAGQGVRQGSAPPGTAVSTPRAELETPRPDDEPLRAPSRASLAASVSMTELDSVAGRVPPRSWISADGIPSPPPNSEWDAGSIRGGRRVSTPTVAVGLHTPAQNLRIHGDPSLGLTMPAPRLALGPTQPSAGSLDMEVEIRKRRAQQAANGNGTAQPGGWYTPKVPAATLAAAGQADDAGGAAGANRAVAVPATPSVRWAPGGPARDPDRPKVAGENTPSGLGLSLTRNTNSGTFAGPKADVGGSGGAGGDVVPGQSAPLDVQKLSVTNTNSELATILEALKQSEAARELQVRQQAELARYVNELHGWLEKDVIERSKEFRILATGVTQLHEEFMKTKQSRPLPPVGRPLPRPGLPPPSAASVSSAPAMSREGSEASSQATTGASVSSAPAPLGAGMPIPVVTLGDSPTPITDPPVGSNPYATAASTAPATPAAAAPPTTLRPGAQTTKAVMPPAVSAAQIPFGNGGQWTNLQPPSVNNSAAAAPTKPKSKRAQTRAWHADPLVENRKEGGAWYLPDDGSGSGSGSDKAASGGSKAKPKRPSPLKMPSHSSSVSAASSSSAHSKRAGKKFVAAASGALLVRAALKEWERFKAQQRAEGKPEDPVPVGASGDPVLDQQIPLPEPISDKLQTAAESGSQEGVTAAVREAAQAGLGTQAIIRLTEHVEKLENDERDAAEAEAEGTPLDGDTLAPTPSPMRTRFLDLSNDGGSVRSAKSGGSSITQASGGSGSLASLYAAGHGMGAASNGALAMAVEEILKHLLERKEEEKKRAAEAAAAKAKKEAEKKKTKEAQQLSVAQQKEKEKEELVDMILARLEKEKKRQEKEMEKKANEVDPKTAIESLVTMLNTQREAERASHQSADAAIKELASSLLRTTTEQNGKLVEAVNSAAREMLRHNINAHADELKRTLSKEVAVMFEDVGKIREAKRNLEHEIADLFAIKSRHLNFDPVTGRAEIKGTQMVVPPPSAPWLPPHAYHPSTSLHPLPYPTTTGPAGVDTRSLDPLAARKAARKAAKLQAAKKAQKAEKRAQKAKQDAEKANQDANAAQPPPAQDSTTPAAAATATAKAVVPGFLAGKRDILNPFSVNFGPRAPR
ncbi:hypothetical protein ACQY0O_004030 [Thecaphora frezii]